jgi:hypothetical protein
MGDGEAKQPMSSKKQKDIIQIEVDPLKISKGHPTHRGGAGAHQDRRKKRQRTRNDEQRKVINEQQH